MQRFAFGIGAILIAAVWTFRSTYFQQSWLTYTEKKDPWILSRTVALFRLREFGEIFLNVPGTRLPHFLTVFIPFLGMLLWANLGITLFKQRRKLNFLQIYLVSCSGVILLWPCEDARFWLPALPMLLFQIPQLKSYRMYYALTGLAALAFSIQLTLSGNRFPQKYGNGPLRSTYEAAFNPKEPPFAADVNPDALQILRRYKPRAKRKM